MIFAPSSNCTKSINNSDFHSLTFTDVESKYRLKKVIFASYNVICLDNEMNENC